MGTQRVQIKGVLPWFIRWVQETFILPWLHWSPQDKIIDFLPSSISIYVSRSPSNLGTGQAVVQGRLSLASTVYKERLNSKDIEIKAVLALN